MKDENIKLKYHHQKFILQLISRPRYNCHSHSPIPIPSLSPEFETLLELLLEEGEQNNAVAEEVVKLF